jgi:trehalose 6-phosphate synthase/phosphatase
MANLVIVSNRLPVSVKKVNGKLEFYPSVGGLATGLSSYARVGRNKWIGWPGIPSDDLTDAEQTEIRRELKKHRCYPVFLTNAQLENYYNGYSNSVLWPLFHDLPVKRGATEKNWKSYYAVNALFANEALHLSEPGNTIWVHDYQLLLVPGLLRAERPDDQIGFFLHIPFPAPDLFTTTSHASALLAGMLGADLIGFHTSSYSENFLGSCEQTQIGTRNDKQIDLGTRVLRVTEFPMGIDYTKFAEATKKKAVQTELRRLERRHKGKKVIVTVDRLDPTKGLAERLVAYQQLLAQTPEIHRKVVMVMLAVPSRTDIDEYKQLKKRVEGLVTDINSTYGNTRWQPVDYMFQTLPFEKLSALYERADVAFIAPIRDGMNLVAKEFLASKSNSDGVLILSETAGAAEELKDAVMVNPAQPATLVQGLSRALTMPKRELQRRSSKMQKHIEEFTVQAWADSFMTSLRQPAGIRINRTKNLSKARRQEIVANYHQARRRLFLLDYDGVLRQFTKDPAAATPSARALQLLEHLGSDPANDVVIISGRSKTDLGNWFEGLPIAMAAEHGALFRRKGGKTWHKTSATGVEWQKEVLRLFQKYADLTPGAFVEQKDWAVVWHYRAASPYYSRKHLVILQRLLKPILKAHRLKLKNGLKVLEVHPADVSKGRVSQEWLIHDHDFILAIGDDVTDEDMFAALPPQAYSVKVGHGQTLARFRVGGVDDVLKLLGKL